MSEVPAYNADVPIIALLGPTGVGKSTFIQQATGNANVKIGHGLTSETNWLTIFTTEIDGQKVSLLDTVGFDDTYRSDTEILKEIANWLADTYVHGVQLAGVLYLHNIASPRLQGSVLRNLRMFQKLVGEEQLSNVTLVTTHWNGVNVAMGRERMRILGENDDMWGAMLKRGSTIESFDGTTEDAHSILRKILIRNRRTVLDIQRELVDQKLDLAETAAGKLIREEIAKLQAQHTQEMTQLRSYMKNSLDSKDARFSRLLKEQQTMLDRQQADYQAQIAELEAQNKTLEELQNAHRAQMRQMENLFGDRLQLLEEQSLLPPPTYNAAQSRPEAQDQVSREDTSVAPLSPRRSLLVASVEMIQKLRQLRRRSG